MKTIKELVREAFIEATTLYKNVNVNDWYEEFKLRNPEVEKVSDISTEELQAKAHEYEKDHCWAKDPKYHFKNGYRAKEKELASIVNKRKDSTGSDKSFLNVLIENYEASKRMKKWVLQREILIETYQDLIDIYKANYLPDQLKNNNVGVNDAVEFAEWIRTFDALEKKNGYWVLESQISSEELYRHFLKSQPQQKEESEKELEERTERNMILIDAFCEHMKSENIIIPESVVLSFFNA